MTTDTRDVLEQMAAGSILVIGGLVLSWPLMTLMAWLFLV